MHDRLVRLVLEVAVPARNELREWPALELFQFLRIWTNFDASFDAVGGKWTHAVDVPLVEHLVLGLLVTPREVVEGLNMWLGTVGGEGEVVVLEVEANTRKIYQRLHSCFSELLWVTCADISKIDCVKVSQRLTNSRTLQDQRRAQRATADNGEFASLEVSRPPLAR